MDDMDRRVRQFLGLEVPKKKPETKKRKPRCERPKSTSLELVEEGRCPNCRAFVDLKRLRALAKEIRRLREAGHVYLEIVKITGVSLSVVYRIDRGTHWSVREEEEDD